MKGYLRHGLGCTAAAVALSVCTAWASENPGSAWERYAVVEDAGFAPERLNAAKTYFDSLSSSALMIIRGGRVVAAWGEVNRRFTVHSIRKSLLSALVGIAVTRGTIDTSLTIGELGILERDSLSAQEKTARISHLMKSRSGVYHPAAAESDWQRRLRPERNSHLPDSLWFYNNWDFNVLGAIYERLAGCSIYEAFWREIARPLEMEDFRILDGRYYYERQYSLYPAYHVKMSARDLARYGQLFLQKGVWNGRRIFPASWVELSTFPHSRHGGGTKIGRWYGYLWGVSEYYSRYGMYFASGVGGQFLAVFPGEDMLIVHLCDTYRSRHVLDRELVRLFDLILAAMVGKPSSEPRLSALHVPARIPSTVCNDCVDRQKYLGDWTLGGKSVRIVELDGQLILIDCWQNFRLLPLSARRFFVEDLECQLIVESDKAGMRHLSHDEPGEGPCPGASVPPADDVAQPH